MRSHHGSTRPSMFFPALLGLAACLTATLARADVQVLELPGMSFQSIQTAVNAASDGDTLLLASGSYQGFVIDGKGLTLIALPGLVHEVGGQIEVRNVPLNSNVQLDGLLVRGRLYSDELLFESETALYLEDNVGAVRLTGCELRAGGGPDTYMEYGYPRGGHAARVINSANVAFLDCELIGGDGGGFTIELDFDGWGGSGGHGLWGSSSVIALYDSRLDGGNGGSTYSVGGDGGHGCLIEGDLIFASGCTFQGGAGGDCQDFLACATGTGGTGLWGSAPTDIRLLDNDYWAGLAGNGYYGPGTPGLPMWWGGGTLVEKPGTRRSLTVDSSFVADGGDFSLHFEGEPGDRVYLARGSRPALQFVSGPWGVRLVNLPPYLDVRSVVIADASGHADFVVPALEQPVGGWRSLMAQAVVFPAGGLMVPSGGGIGGAVLLTSMDDESAPDCNGNGVLDLFDVMSGLETDCNGDFVPDSCTPNGDCNANGIDDLVDTECGSSPDLNGNGVPDECEGAITVYVDAAAPAGGDGTATAPFDNLSDAFAQALDGWAIEIAAGTYTGPENRNLDLAGRSLEIYSPAGSAGCLIDLEQSGFAFGTNSSAGDILFRGLTIERGFINYSDSYPAAGIWSTGTGRVTLEDCVLQNCQGTGTGSGGLYVVGELYLSDCVFDGNTAFGNNAAAGAVYCAGRVSVTRTLFTGNSARDGGALHLESTAPFAEDSVISHCAFRGNGASYRGGALLIEAAGQHRIDNCLFEGNAVSGVGTPLSSGGAISVNPMNFETTLTITSSTLANNSALEGSYGGGACYFSVGTRTTILNSVLWGNTAANGSSIRFTGVPNDPALLDIGFCDLEQGIAGIFADDGIVNSGAVMDLDPLFVDPIGGNFSLGAGSPCIDAGGNWYLAADLLDSDQDGDTGEVVPLDLAGNPREVDDPLAPDTGVGSAPLTDLGALER